MVRLLSPINIPLSIEPARGDPSENLSTHAPLQDPMHVAAARCVAVAGSTFERDTTHHPMKTYQVDRFGAPKKPWHPAMEKMGGVQLYS